MQSRIWVGVKNRVEDRLDVNIGRGGMVDGSGVCVPGGSWGFMGVLRLLRGALPGSDLHMPNLSPCHSRRPVVEQAVQEAGKG